MPTHLIQKYLEEFARWIRNDQEYDDWDVGMEPIPGDRTWTNKKCGNCESCSCKLNSKDANK